MKTNNIKKILAIFLLISTTTFAKPAEKASDEGFGFGAVPALAFSSDAGFGFGVVGKIYKKSPSYQPYRYSVGMQLFMTTEQVHSHWLKLDVLDLFGMPLRLVTKGGFFVTKNHNYCGKGSLANCNEGAAAAAGKELGFSGDELSDFKWRYYKRRYKETYGEVQARWKLKDLPNKAELVMGWRGSYYRMGDLSSTGPYPDSKFVKDFFKEGLSTDNEQGFASVIETGVMFDSRNNEPAPTKGYWIEALMRGSSPGWGSKWDYAGLNLTFRAYTPFDKAHRWVLANQIIFDGVIGDMPLAEVVRIGGSMGYTGIGGSEIGRGIRQELFPGRINVIKQAELRYTFAGFNLLNQHFDATAVGFFEAAMLAWSLKSLESEPFKLIGSFGGGFRLAWNKNFIIRLDVGLSPIEHYAPRIYLKVSNVF